MSNQIKLNETTMSVTSNELSLDHSLTTKIIEREPVCISFHSLPVEKNQKNAWLRVVRKHCQEAISLNKLTKLCSLHFKPSEYYSNIVSGCRTLRVHAIPSIFQSKDLSLPDNVRKQLGISQLQNYALDDSISMEAENNAGIMLIPEVISTQDDEREDSEQLETEHLQSFVHEHSNEFEDEHSKGCEDEHSKGCDEHSDVFLDEQPELPLRGQQSESLQDEHLESLGEERKLVSLEEKYTGSLLEKHLKSLEKDNFKTTLAGNLKTALKENAKVSLLIDGNSLNKGCENLKLAKGEQLEKFPINESKILEMTQSNESLDMIVESGDEEPVSNDSIIVSRPQPLITITKSSTASQPVITVLEKTSQASGSHPEPQPSTATTIKAPVFVTVKNTSNEVLFLQGQERESSESIGKKLAKKRKLEAVELVEKLESAALAEKKKLKAVAASEKRKLEAAAAAEKRKLDDAVSAEKRKYNAMALESRKYEAEAFRLEIIRKKQTAEITYLGKKLSVCKNELSALKQTRALETRELGLLREKVRGLTMSLDMIKNKNDDVLFYTGMHNYESFVKLYEFLNPGENGEHLMVFYNVAAKNKRARREEFPIVLNDAAKNAKNAPPLSSVATSFGGKTGRPKKMPCIDQLLMVMMRLKLGLFPQDLSIRFGVSLYTINRMCICWINFIYHRFSTEIIDKIWMTREQIDKEMPKDIQNKYAKTRLIISKAEIKCEVVENNRLHFNNMTLKNYRGLLGISPTGKVTFVSPLYEGMINDQELIQRSGLLQQDFSYGDVILTTERLYIDHLISEIGKNVTAFVPSFLKSASEEIHKGENGKARNEQAVRLGFRVRRRTQKLKNFHIFDRPICTTLAPYANQLWMVCVILSNYQNPPPKLMDEGTDGNDADDLE